MAGPIPALGYPSRTAAAVALNAQGLSVHAIGNRLGITRKNAAALLYSAQRDNAQRAHPTRPAIAAEPPVNFPIDVLAELRPQAIKRGTNVTRLARDIVEIAALGGLIDAILDDEAADA